MAEFEIETIAKTAVAKDKLARAVIYDVQKVLANFGSYEVGSNEDFEGAANDLQVLKIKANELESAKKAILDPLNTARKAVSSLFEPAETMVKKCINVVSGAMVVWRQKIEAEAAAERMRIEEERRRLEEEGRAKIRAEMAKAIEAGDTEHADALVRAIENPEPVRAPSVPTIVVPKVAGTSMRTTYHAEVIDEKAVPREWCCPDLKRLEAYARETEGRGGITGVRFYSKQTVVSRGTSAA